MDQLSGFVLIGLFVLYFAYLIRIGEDGQIKAISPNSRVFRGRWKALTEDFTLFDELEQPVATVIGWRIQTAAAAFSMRKIYLTKLIFSDYRWLLEREDGTLVTKDEGTNTEPMFAYDGQTYCLKASLSGMSVHREGKGVLGSVRTGFYRGTEVTLPEELPPEFAVFIIALSRQVTARSAV